MVRSFANSTHDGVRQGEFRRAIFIREIFKPLILDFKRRKSTHIPLTIRFPSSTLSSTLRTSVRYVISTNVCTSEPTKSTRPNREINSPRTAVGWAVGWKKIHRAGMQKLRRRRRISRLPRLHTDNTQLSPISAAGYTMHSIHLVFAKKRSNSAPEKTQLKTFRVHRSRPTPITLFLKSASRHSISLMDLE